MTNGIRFYMSIIQQQQKVKIKKFDFEIPSTFYFILLCNYEEKNHFRRLSRKISELSQKRCNDLSVVIIYIFISLANYF